MNSFEIVLHPNDGMIPKKGEKKSIFLQKNYLIFLFHQ